MRFLFDTIMGIEENNIDIEIDDVLSGATIQSKKTKTVQEEDETDNSPMGKLLKDYKFKVPQEGDKIKGKVIQTESNAVYIDLGELGTGVVYGKEIKNGFGTNKRKLQFGDEVIATIIDLENDEGYVDLSIREAMREEAWKDLNKKKSQHEVINAKVIDVNKGGLMFELNGITGFMPVSQLTAEHYPRVEDGDKNKIFEILKTYLGQEMKVCVIDATPEEEKLIFSEKEAYKDSERKAISEFKVGDIVEGEISGVVDFGAFVKFFPPSKKNSQDEKDMLEGLVHISQLDWKLIENPRDIVKVGDKVKVKIISIDETRISLSMRDLKKDPWAKVAENYKTGDMVEGEVNKINHFGAFVYLDRDIHGLAHISEFISKYPGKNIDDIIKVGDKYQWQIMSLEPSEHRMGLKFIGKKKDVKKEDVTVEEAKVEEKTGEKTAEKKEKKIDKIEKAEKKEEKSKKEAKPKKTKK